jgi:hypothetical protein
MLLAIWAVVAALLAMAVNIAVFHARLPSADRGAESFRVLLQSPLVTRVGLLIALGGALLGWIGAVFTLLDTRLRVTVPVVAGVAVLAAAVAPSGDPFLDAPFVLIAVWTAEIACRLVSERRARRRAGLPPRAEWTGRARRVLVLAAVACAGLSMAASLVAGTAWTGEPWWTYLAMPFALCIAVPIATLAGAAWLLAAAATLEPRDLGTTLPAAVLATVFCSALFTIVLGQFVVPAALMAGWVVMFVGHRASAARPGLAR